MALSVPFTVFLALFTFYGAATYQSEYGGLIAGVAIVVIGLAQRVGEASHPTGGSSAGPRTRLPVSSSKHATRRFA